MASAIRELLAGIATVNDMVDAFQDDERCRRLIEAMVWPDGRICPACGCRQSIALAGRDLGRRARPGLYQCSSAECRFQFTVTTRTALHSTKLPLRVWLTALWLILQSDETVAAGDGRSLPPLRPQGSAGIAGAWRWLSALPLNGWTLP